MSYKEHGAKQLRIYHLGVYRAVIIYVEEDSIQIIIKANGPMRKKNSQWNQLKNMGINGKILQRN